MQIRAIYRGARISAFKCREVTREIQGLPVAAALDILTYTARKGARLVEKTLKSAIANAENNNRLRADKLVVKEAVVGEGPTFKRFQPKARGSAGPIRKRTSHIRIILTDEIAIPPKRSAKTATSRKKNKSQSSKSPKATRAVKAAEPETAAPVESTSAAAETSSASVETNETQSTQE